MWSTQISSVTSKQNHWLTAGELMASSTHRKHNKKGIKWDWKEWWGEREWGDEVSDGVRHWLTEKKKKRKQSEARSSPQEIFKSSGRDKSVRVITHSVCSLWFMEWDRNWLTERRAPPSYIHTHTHPYVLGCCTQSKLLTGHFGPAQLLNKRPVVSLSLAPSFYKACPSI